MKKMLLGIGSVATIVPVVSVISCSLSDLDLPKHSSVVIKGSSGSFFNTDTTLDIDCDFSTGLLKTSFTLGDQKYLFVEGGINKAKRKLTIDGTTQTQTMNDSTWASLTSVQEAKRLIVNYMTHLGILDLI